MDAYLDEEVMNEYDVFTVGIPNALIYCKGLFTMFKNNEESMEFFHYPKKKIVERIKRGKAFGIEETSFSNHIISNNSISFYLQVSATADGVYSRRVVGNQGLLEWKEGKVFMYLGRDENPLIYIREQLEWDHDKVIERDNCDYWDSSVACRATEEGNVDLRRKKGKIMKARRSPSKRYPSSMFHFYATKKSFKRFFHTIPQNNFFILFDFVARETHFLPPNFSTEMIKFRKFESEKVKK